MDRDAPLPLPPSVHDVVPPVAWETVRKVALTGLALAGAAAALGLVATFAGEVPSVLHTARLLLVFAAGVFAGSAVSLRATMWQAWALGAATAAAAWVGTPAHWDSFRLLFAVLGAVAIFGAVLAAAPVRWRLRLVSAFIVFHFCGILMATTAPPPTPWLTDQLYQRVYNPYLQFAYLRNAYHFYSPEPGPASLLFCLIKTETGEQVGDDGVKRKTYSQKWVVLPKRPADVRDPLGLTYYRRLAITEGASRSIPDIMLPQMFEKTEMQEARQQLTLPGSNPQIPFHPIEPGYLQYRLPTPDIMRFVLPSYSQHLILANTPDPEAALKTTVKIYRVEHRTLSVQDFRGGVGPYHPTTYKPYFVGEFNAYGELVNPREPMLYWLVPVSPRPGGTAADPKKNYDDYLSVHAGHEFDWSQLR